MPYPIQVDFELNATCNLSCPMCPLSVEVNSQKKHLIFPFEVFARIVDDGVKKGLKVIRFNYLNEPLLRKDLEDFIIYAKQKGIIDTYFSTNGMLLSKERAKSLIQSGLDRIQISIDAASKEVYDRVRIGGNFDRVVKNVFGCLEAKKELKSQTPLIRVNFVKTEINEHELEEFIDFWEDKVDMIGVQDMIKPPKSSQDLKSYTTAKLKEFQCSFPNKLLVITAEGNVLPCCTFYGDEMPLGNILEGDREVDLAEFWNSKPMRELRELHINGCYKDNPICKKCVEDSTS